MLFELLFSSWPQIFSCEVLDAYGQFIAYEAARVTNFIAFLVQL
jgi:hypothetical protein